MATPPSELPVGAVLLHACAGVARLWIPAGIYQVAQCKCGAPLTADVAYRPDHAHYPCSRCRATVGICSAPLLEQVEAWAVEALGGGDG